jgi:hypothetical protein
MLGQKSNRAVLSPLNIQRRNLLMDLSPSRVQYYWGPTTNEKEENILIKKIKNEKRRKYKWVSEGVEC